MNTTELRVTIAYPADHDGEVQFNRARPRLDHVVTVHTAWAAVGAVATALAGMLDSFAHGGMLGHIPNITVGDVVVFDADGYTDAYAALDAALDVARDCMLDDGDITDVGEWRPTRWDGHNHNTCPIAAWLADHDEWLAAHPDWFDDDE